MKVTRREVQDTHLPNSRSDPMHTGQTPPVSCIIVTITGTRALPTVQVVR